jgi:hypothetical protein
MAMRMPSDLGSSGLGSVQRTLLTKFGNEFYVLSRTRTNEKRKPVKLRWLKESY